MTSERTYLDWNATAPLLPEARAAMADAMEVCGNPSSVHAEGRRARAIVETAREQVAALVGAKPSEVVFTSGATEACNLVLAAGWRGILRSEIEHDAVLKPTESGPSATVDVAVDRAGTIEITDLTTKARAAAAEHGAGGVMVALQLANNETGVIQPVADAANVAHDAGAVIFTDAVQAAGRIPVDFATLGADFMALSAHKFGGPKGIGALVIRDGIELPALIEGGGQERRRRGGTENVSGIAGFGAAAHAAQNTIVDRGRMAQLRDRMEAGLLNLTPGAQIISTAAERLPNTTCVATPGQTGETLVIRFDLAGIAISAGAACSSGKIGASRVLLAMGLPESVARSAVRISIGPATTERDIDRFLSAWRDIAAETPARTAA